MHDYLTLRPVLIFCLLLNMAGESACGANPSAFRAGLARAKITPSQPGWLLAYDRHQKAEGVETDLWVRALAIQDPDGRRAVLVSADILGFPPSLSQEIHQQARLRHQLERGQILLAASHTHNGPVLPDRPSLEIYHDFSEQEAKSVHAYGRKLCEHVLDAIGTALADLQPAELSFSRGRATFGLNRRLSRNPDGPTDPEVPVLKIEGANGTLRAVVFGYACHGTTVMADTFFKYFGDYSGVAQEVLETQLPGTTALFLAGCGGDINPEPRGKVELAYVHGRTLATEVRSVLQKPDGWVRLTGAFPPHTDRST